MNLADLIAELLVPQQQQSTGAIAPVPQPQMPQMMQQPQMPQRVQVPPMKGGLNVPLSSTGELFARGMFNPQDPRDQDWRLGYTQRF